MIFGDEVGGGPPVSVPVEAVIFADEVLCDWRVKLVGDDDGVYWTPCPVDPRGVQAPVADGEGLTRYGKLFMVPWEPGDVVRCAPDWIFRLPGVRMLGSLGLS